MERTNWIKPNLQVILRTKPEEYVLGSCKIVSTRGTRNAGPNDQNEGCYDNIARGRCNATCTGIGIS